ncbi:MAG TPA: EI24 domain-containing protein [Gemmataceae bacterium]|jgi:CysZ protein|nr:EI24 domain-containing protein [Gemmataceae bacterium]
MKREDEIKSFGVSAAMEAVGSGIGFILRTPAMWPWSFVPGAIMFLLLAGFCGFGIWGSAELSKYFFGPDRHFWGSIGYWIVTVLLGIVSFLVAVLLALVLTEPLSAFALDKIVHAYEHHVTGSSSPSPPLPVVIWISVRSIGFGLILGGTALVALLAINFLFPPAAIVTVPLKFLVCSWMLAWSLIDYPMVQRRLGIRARLRWVFRHFAAFTVFGMAWAAFAVMPGIVLVLLPMGVAGATDLVLRDEPRGPARATVRVPD